MRVAGSTPAASTNFLLLTVHHLRLSPRRQPVERMMAAQLFFTRSPRRNTGLIPHSRGLDLSTHWPTSHD